MLVIIPDTLWGCTGAVLSALIVVFCVIGLTMHKDFYAGIPRKSFFCFYTNLSNLLVGVYFALAAPFFYARRKLHPLIPHAEFSLMMSIMLTFAVFHLLLFPSIRGVVSHAEHTREYRIVCTDNFIIHYLVPWLVFFYWLLCSPDKAQLSIFDAFLWTVFPLTYIGITFLRARSGQRIKETGTAYPYPFLDVDALGSKTVLRMCLILSGVSVISGVMLLLLLRAAIALFGSGHALILI